MAGSKRSVIISFVVLAVVLVAALAGYRFLAPQVEAESPAPVASSESAAPTASSDAAAQVPEDFTVFDESDAPVALSDMRGKPTLIVFWATWCPYCVQEAPDVETLYGEYGDKVNFMGIDAVGGRETVDVAKAWIERNGYTYPFYFDTQGQAMSTFNVSGLPTTVLLNAQGEVVYSAPGRFTIDAMRSRLADVVA